MDLKKQLTKSATQLSCSCGEGARRGEETNKRSMQQEEMGELYDLQDRLEQYTRKNSLEFHGIPESAYNSTEEAIS